MNNVSVVIPTLGDSSLLDAVLSSLSRYGQDFLEILIIRQGNASSFVPEFLLKPNVRVVDVDFRGLSKAKNFAAHIAEGEYLFFLDDDAELLADTNAAIASLFAKYPNFSGYFGKTIDREGGDSVIRFASTAAMLTRDNYVGRSIECPSVIRRDLLLQLSFDEELGAGSFCGAEEGRDFMIRAISVGALFVFDPDLRVYHPQKANTRESLDTCKRAFFYRAGLGYLCAKHGLYIDFAQRIMKDIIGIIGSCILIKRSKYFFIFDLIGLLMGYLYFKARFGGHIGGSSVKSSTENKT